VIRRVLVANRGEIAVRIIRACRALGIETVQVYSDADRDCLAVRLADRAVGIGRGPARESYLNAPSLLGAAIFGECDAIHPGYGFLSESGAFAEQCARKGFTFIGPQAEVICLMGDKAAALRIAGQAGVPTVPGSDGPVADPQAAATAASRLGYPVLLKAVAGGGGRGMRVVESARSLGKEFVAAQSEARAAFGDPGLYIERYLPDVRHVEVQLAGDGSSVIHLGERDCTIQRRHQKLIEESPSPVLDARSRESLCGSALRIARQVGLRNVSTAEFVLDNATREFFFIEMNTRLQVEHPVTEAVTGIDLVQLQIRLAAGEKLPLSQQEVRARGCAIECRVNAERMGGGFVPCPGTISGLRLPSGPRVRVDTHAYPGAAIPPYYDSLIAKLVVSGDSRPDAISRTRRALDELSIEGVESNIALHRSVMDHPRFQSGEFNTRFLDALFGADKPAASGAEIVRR